MCLDKKVLAGAAVAAAAIYVLAPNLIGAALPVLVMAICPLSMLIMMKAMARRDDTATEPARDGEAAAELADLRREVAELRQARPESAAALGTER